ncbi:MAG: IS4 family transposase [Steroidobacteraceae bacterium]
MAKTFCCEDAEVEAIMAASAESPQWLREEFSGIDLGDKRLDRRLMRTAELLGKAPISPINEACKSWASTQAAYRLFDNGRASPEAIRAPHIAATVKRMVACGGPVLVMQDTVFFSYGRHPKTRGLGPIGKSNEAHDRGLIMHDALAFTATGVPLGLLSQTIWARQEVPEEKFVEKVLRLQCTAIEEKESSKWLVALKETVARTPRGVKVVTIADRESDCFEFLTAAKQLSARYVIRACRDRKLLPEESAGWESMLEALGSAAVLGTLEVAVPGNGKRKARTASVELKVAEVAIRPPRRRGHAWDSGPSDPVSVKVIAATESAPPAGEDAISWVLLTNLPVPDFQAASEKVQWYGRRWGIETWHKVIKSGCQVEKCLLESAERLARYLTLFSIIAVRMMHVTYLARLKPDLPATEVFSQAEIEALHVQVRRALPPRTPPSLREVVRMLGGLGGHLGRKCDGEPGMTVIWRGWMTLYATVAALRAAREAGLIPSS